jgi:hypothetical protein
LRLWLSLAIEFEGDDPPPLPNLKFEIEVGDSLAAPGPEPGQSLMREVAVRQFSEAKAEYMKAHGSRKHMLEQKVNELKQSIGSWTHGKRTIEGFDWAVEFADVFQEGGFDVVVANPPYIRQELITDQKPALTAVFPEVYNGTADLYVFFYARGLEILRSSGMLCFISSNKWFKANYGVSLRKHISATCHVRSITDFGGLPVFKSATAYPMIFVARRKVSSDGGTVLYTEVPRLDPPYPDVRAIVRQHGETLPQSAIQGSSWLLVDSVSADRMQRMSAKGMPLGEYAKGKLFRGVVTGLNDAFIIDDATRRRLIAEDKRSSELIKPFVRGKDIRKWRVEPKDNWLIFTRRGVDINRYPAIKRHLAQWKRGLEPKPSDWPTRDNWPGRKPGHYKWFEIQDEVAYFGNFDKPKIFFPDIAKSLRFAFDPKGLWGGNTTYFVCTEDLYLLGVLNSASVEELYIQMSAQIRGGYLRFFTQYVERIPIPDASSSHKSRIVSLVKKCIDAEGSGCTKWEAEIDSLVADLYGVTLRAPAVIGK